MFSLLLITTLAAASSPLNFDFPFTATEPVPFRAAVDPEFIAQTVQKAGLYRPSIDLLDNDLVNPAWEEGSDSAFMTDLAKHWVESYDWFEEQDIIFSNGSHYAVTIPEGGGDYEHPVSFHFVHERSGHEGAIPLLILHGWPSSHLEFSKVLEPLSSPEDPSAQAFHVIVPDIPGFGFSPAPTYSGLGSGQLAEALDKLMKKLGYNRYAVAGTDLGHFVGLFMNQLVPDSLIGYYSDFWITAPNATDLERYALNQTTEEETRYIAAYQEWFTYHYAHGPAHSMAPLAISQAMSDTPVGFAGWMFQLAAPLSAGFTYTLTEIITNTMMLFIQGTYGNIRSYREVFFYVSSGHQGATSLCATSY
jgi:pimeloyl-ACP methyl ester carboxylesterase